MKKILLAFISLAWAPLAFAQSTSVISDIYNNNNLSLSKIDNIEKTTEQSLDVVKQSATDWNNELTRGNNELKESSNQIQQVIQYLNDKEEEFFEVESDPRGGSYQVYATKPVPSCYGDTSRLAYNGGNWVCTEPITCGAVNTDQEGWIQSEDGYCTRKQGTWKTGSWSSRSNGQSCGSRSVACRDEVTNASLGNNHCSQPAPTSSRECTTSPSSFPCPAGAPSCPNPPPPPPPPPPSCTTTGTWQTDEWGECVNGVQSRSVSCSGCNCSGSKPASTRTSQCASDPEGTWAVEDTCVNGQISSKISCVGGTCDPATKPSPNSGTCSTEWTVGEWGSCDSNNMRQRNVSCSSTSCNGDEPAKEEPCACIELLSWGERSSTVLETKDAKTGEPLTNMNTNSTLGWLLESDNTYLYSNFGLTPNIDIGNDNGAAFRAKYTLNLNKSLIKDAFLNYVWVDDIAWIRINGHTMYFGSVGGNNHTGGGRFDHLINECYMGGRDDKYEFCQVYSISDTGGKHSSRGDKKASKKYYNVNIFNQLKDGLNEIEADLVVGGAGELYFNFKYDVVDNKNICGLSTLSQEWQTGPWTFNYMSPGTDSNGNHSKLCTRTLTCQATSCEMNTKPNNGKWIQVKDSNDKSCDQSGSEFYNDNPKIVQ